LQYLLLKFFKFYSKWEWPNPINLITYATKRINNGINEQKKTWNPISSVADSQHLMPIISPEIIQGEVPKSLV
jgi:poly(A) polymerase Pap1